MNIETKICNKCNLNLPIIKFGKSGKSKDGLRQPCKECRGTQTIFLEPKQNSNLIGEKYNHLLVNKYSHTKNGSKYWECLCDCGNICFAPTGRLKNGKKKTCGCLIFHSGKESNLFTGCEEISGSWWSHVNYQTKRHNKNIEITIKVEDVWNLYLKQNRKCALTSLDISFKDISRIKLKRTASLDRIDSSKGYTIDNIQIVHKDINKMKMDYSQEYFIEMCNLISNNNKNKI